MEGMDAMDFFERKHMETGVLLNDVQKQVVLKTDGPLLVLACPGSGKTTTMIMRIGFMIAEKGIAPARIKPITFSKAAADDMRGRFTKLFPGLQPPAFSTIHSLALDIVRRHLDHMGVEWALIEGKTDQVPPKPVLLKRSFREVTGEDPTEDELKSVGTFASFVKNRLIPQSEWPGVKGPVERAGEILQKYESHKRSRRRLQLLDFDDMLTIAEEALRTDPDLCKRMQDRFDYVITDESQDTSLAQHRIVEHLVRRHGNLCAVADDDQSIYTWRGADPEYLLDFRSHYPQAEILMMETNYRSSEEITETAAGFIKRNKERYEKGMKPVNGSAGPVSLKRFHDRDEQVRYVIYELLAMENPEEAAVLFRNNSSSTAFVSELHRRGIPFYMKDADDRFFDHWVVEDILNFMRLAYLPERKDLFARVALKMDLYISRAAVEAFVRNGPEGNVFEVFARSGTPLSDDQKRKLASAGTIYEGLKERRPADIIRTIRTDLGYEASLKSRSEKFGYRIDTLTGMLDTLAVIAAPLRTMTAFAEKLAELKEAVSEAKRKPREGAVTLSTLHSAKGLEFKQVFMVDLNEGTIPAAEDVKDPDMMEEARRLFYVGMTRAKERLELINYSTDSGKDLTESRFISEVRGLQAIGRPVGQRREPGRQPKRRRSAADHNPDAISDRGAFVPGLRVRHKVFGNGQVEEIRGDRILVKFAKQEKELDIGMCISRGLLEERG
ncbi:ATP-dependent helicase [Bhargavaea ginsengi]|uniref:ATP-dependent helicase n=1 Tax=Bhargavaea ginsengi TaxID=426757 RepID=UPI00203E00E6|nr:ATP-dependent helicase [Bhargavaea ginsengi]MCM3086329.1 ATP-dependent helicase [Bhargavaea ginsengi]